MPIITDPDNLNQGTEVVFDTSEKTIGLSIAGNLSTDGVTLKALYSFAKEEWKNDADLIKFPFAFTPITDEQFELVNGWNFADNTTKNLIRTGGWAVKNNAGVSSEEYAGIVSLGSIGASDQPYFQQVDGGAPTDFELTGAVNQAVQIYGDATHGNFDYRDTFNIFVREQGKIYAQATLDDIGVTEMSYQVYRFPLANADDLKVTHEDTDITTLAPYTGMSIEWFATPQARTIGATSYNFHVIVDGNGGTLEQVYEFIQYKLRQTSDIDDGAGTKIGKVTSALNKFVGDNYYTLVQSEGGVYIDNFNLSDTNRLYVVDDTGTNRSFPYVATLTLQFGENLVNDANAIFRVFFTNDDAGNNAGADYGTTNAILVQDNDDVAMSGTISSNSSLTFSYDYDGNVQRGAASAGDDAPVTVIAIGLDTAQFVKATGTITRSTSNVVSLTSSLERNYQND